MMHTEDDSFIPIATAGAVAISHEQGLSSLPDSEMFIT